MNGLCLRHGGSHFVNLQNGCLHDVRDASLVCGLSQFLTAWRLVLSMKPWSYIWLEFGLFSTIIYIYIYIYIPYSSPVWGWLCEFAKFPLCRRCTTCNIASFTLDSGTPRICRVMPYSLCTRPRCLRIALDWTSSVPSSRVRAGHCPYN